MREERAETGVSAMTGNALSVSGWCERECVYVYVIADRQQQWSSGRGTRNYMRHGLDTEDGR